MLPELRQRLEPLGALGAFEDRSLPGMGRQVAVEGVRPEKKLHNLIVTRSHKPCASNFGRSEAS